jgi:hypothetical protein
MLTVAAQKAVRMIIKDPSILVPTTRVDPIGCKCKSTTIKDRAKVIEEHATAHLWFFRAAPAAPVLVFFCFIVN